MWKAVAVEQGRRALFNGEGCVPVRHASLMLAGLTEREFVAEVFILGLRSVLFRGTPLPPRALPAEEPSPRGLGLRWKRGAGLERDAWWTRSSYGREWQAERGGGM